MIKSKFKVFFWIFLVLFSFNVVYSIPEGYLESINREDTGYLVPASGEVRISLGYADHIIRNSCGKDLYVPTRTRLEYDYFIANRPDCLTRFTCEIKYVSLGSYGSTCRPADPGSIYLNWGVNSGTNVWFEYCTSDPSREVSSEIDSGGFEAIIAAQKLAAENLMNNASIELDRLEFIIIPSLNETDNGTAQRLIGLRSAYDSGVANFTLEEYSIASEVFLGVIDKTLRAPYDGSSAAELELEASFNYDYVKADYDALIVYVDGNSFTPSIDTKLVSITSKILSAKGRYDDGVYYISIENNASAVTSFQNSLIDLDSLKILIPQVRIDIETTSGNRITTAQNTWDGLDSDGRDISTSINNALDNAEDDLNDAIALDTAEDYVASIQITNDLIGTTLPQINSDIATATASRNNARDGVNDAQDALDLASNQLSNLGYPGLGNVTYEDEGDRINGLINDAQDEIDTAYNMAWGWPRNYAGSIAITNPLISTTIPGIVSDIDALDTLINS